MHIIGQVGLGCEFEWDGELGCGVSLPVDNIAMYVY